jgi:hypothetical protein
VTPEDLSLDHLAALAAASEVPLRDRLIGAMRGRSELIEVHRPFPADQAIVTYQGRLRLWQHDLLPTMSGFPEFVAAIETARGADVAIGVHEDPGRSRRFILLVDADLSSLLGAVELAVGTAREDRSDESLVL